MGKLPAKDWLDPFGYTMVNDYGDTVSNQLIRRELKINWIINVLEMIWNKLDDKKETDEKDIDLDTDFGRRD